MKFNIVLFVITNVIYFSAIYRREKDGMGYIGVSVNDGLQ